ncbi:uncharacterized protein EV420DRAFT_1560634 [Desarmillaria tabescens]|uniref:Uncharacterized protein n=1 Tax=Armillaria tabescens TaxID=1929756 RepID=A0AA39JYP1_ARMTA|nr:uncharacterized protein EV420DRAFT_1560634 [Desarmillaria tabescens]KAK0451371.1 hypothetical protein EV420DRAFT_1560634 [Desarmillaria tabescens]
MSQRAQDIYPSSMLSKVHGYPLWLPDMPSNLPDAYLCHGTQIDDVGYLGHEFSSPGYLDEYGGFEYLFNVCKSAEDPVNLNRVPPDFEPIQSPGVLEQRGFDKDSVITSTSVVVQRSTETKYVSCYYSTVPILTCNSSFQFPSSNTRGAVLILLDGSESYNSKNPSLLAEYAAANAHSWYKYVNDDQGRMIPNGSLYLVTGCDKCRSWGNGCFADWHPTLEFYAPEPEKPHYQWVKHSASGLHLRYHHSEGTVANQTIFLRGYSISVRTKREDSILRWILGMSRTRDAIPYCPPHRLPGVWVQRFPAEGEIVNPSASINNHILDTYCSTNVALTHDHYMGMVNNVQKLLKAVELANDFIPNTDLVFITKSSGTNGAWIANRGFTDILGNQRRRLDSKDAEILEKLTRCTPEQTKGIIGLRPRLPVRTRLMLALRGGDTRRWWKKDDKRVR